MKTEAIRYTVDQRPYAGALIYDEEVAGARPALLMGTNWLGVTPLAIERGRLLAGNRYAVFVADMYGENIRPAGFEQAAALANPLRANPDEARRRISGAYRSMLEEGGSRGLVDAGLTAAIGFCFGGGNVLELARSGADIKAAISVHGDLTSPKPARRGDIKAAILALHGSADPVSPKGQRDEFEAEMTNAGVKWQITVFGGLLHAFTDEGEVPGIAKYDKAASRWTYDLSHAFLADAFSRRL